MIAPGATLRRWLTAACVVAALLQAHGVVTWPGVATLERALYDMRLRWLAPAAPEYRVVIVDIDEASLAKEGHWPWPRERLAQLVNTLIRRQGAAVVAFDMVFAEPTAPDGVLAQALSEAPVVVGYYFSSDRGGAHFGELPSPFWRLRPNELALKTSRWTGYGANTPELANVAEAGFFNAITDADGLVRRVPLVAQWDEALYESLALRTYRIWAGFTEVKPVKANPDLDPSGTRLQGVMLSGAQRAPQFVPLDDAGGAWVGLRHRQGAGSAFTHVSAADLLKSDGPWPELRDKVVLIGASAPGLQDIHATPMSSVYPGVEVQASLLADLMSGHVVATPPESRALGWLVVAVAGLLLLVVLPAAGPLAAALWSAGAVLVLLGLGWWAQVAQARVLPLAPAVAMALAALLLNMAQGFVAERRMRRLTDWFSSYLPPTLVQEMSGRHQRDGMRADYRELTVLFCDIRGFTGMAERLEPQRLQSLLNQTLTTLTHCVTETHGTLDKYMGDSVMAFWGAPVATDEHARLAVQCAQSMVTAVEALNHKLSSQGLPHITVGVGVATGEVFVGDMGSTTRRAYTVVGDAVNVASRLEGLSKRYEWAIVASRSTVEAVPELDWRLIDNVQVRGREQSEAIYGLHA